MRLHPRLRGDSPHHHRQHVLNQPGGKRLTLGLAETLKKLGLGALPDLHRPNHGGHHRGRGQLQLPQGQEAEIRHARQPRQVGV